MPCPKIPEKEYSGVKLLQKEMGCSFNHQQRSRKTIPYRQAVFDAMAPECRENTELVTK